jgi:hypothetical protein
MVTVAPEVQVASTPTMSRVPEALLKLYVQGEPAPLNPALLGISLLTASATD